MPLRAMKPSSKIIDDLIAAERLPAEFRQAVDAYYIPLVARIIDLRRHMARPIVVGICGSQGSGKSTAAVFLKALLEAHANLNTAVLSLDDLYLSHETRQQLAAEAHPLLQTRGVPGTHDVALGCEVIEKLSTAAPDDVTRLPRFDKANDTVAPCEEWPAFKGRADVVIFEGWCVGARAQRADALINPINDLERMEDKDGRWRRYVNDKLAGEYVNLFSRLDYLVFLCAPGFDCVYDWRAKQERKLAEKVKPSDAAARVMNDAELRRFIMHYERLTRHIMDEMPGYADVVFNLDANQSIISIKMRLDA